MSIQLGATAKDKITGLEGVVTGRATYITGCDQYLIQPRNTEKDAKWIDEQRLDVSGAPVLVIDNSRGNGADRPAPVK